MKSSPPAARRLEPHGIQVQNSATPPNTPAPIRLGWTGAGRLDLRLLGPMTVSREGVALVLPASRKVRALIAYLTLADKAVARSHLCELLWDVPNDPRAEFRWCLSKIRGLLGDPGRRRLESYGDAVKLDLADCVVDVAQIARATHEGVDRLAPERLRGLAALFVGDFLDGREIERCARLNTWLIAQRRRFRADQIAVLEHIVRRLPAGSDDAFGYLEKWLELAPFDRHAHQVLLDALARRGRIREGEEHLSAAARLFEAGGLDAAPVREAWRRAKVRATSIPAAAGARIRASPSQCWVSTTLSLHCRSRRPCR
jgi:DNA-binding SARP family transcriptional activator